VLLTILGLFLFGSFKYQIHKNALTYGMLLVILATFVGLPSSGWHTEVAGHGIWWWVQAHLLSFAGLDDLIHADTMLFLLGLTLFVSVIAQTRLLEGVTFVLLRRNRGLILPTVIAVTAVVALASGVLDGVSMIGLTIRTLVIIMTLAAVPPEAVRYAVMVCTAVTTICGVWLAYGEPPNLIMKANLDPHLGSLFFLVYCAPAAVAAYAVIALQLRTRLRGKRGRSPCRTRGVGASRHCQDPQRRDARAGVDPRAGAARHPAGVARALRCRRARGRPRSSLRARRRRRR
jgi:Na+/H+ antiporter NhaD/arsenite permease-like protein